MRLLLDTHALLWWLNGGKQLSKEARHAISSESSLVWVSIVSAWEIALKRSIGKLKSPGNLAQELQRHSFELLQIELADTEALGSLEFHHRDPFDRMLVVQAQRENLTIVTRDPNIPHYGVKCLNA